MPLRRRASTRRYTTRSRPKVRRGFRSRRTYRRRGGALRYKWKNPLPQSTMVKMRYSDDAFSMSLDQETGYNGIRTFRGNSLYDPDYSGVGVQPYGYDQMVAMFSAYRVCGSKIRVNYTTTSTVASQVKVIVFPSRVPTPTFRDPSDVSVLPWAKVKTFSANAGITGRNWISNYCTAKRMLKIIGSGDANYACNANENPGIPWYWCIVFDSSSASEEVTIRFDVQIKYYAIMNKYDSLNES